ncbi:hypothetical protein ACFL4K_03200 [Candidatus Neomarinimicrobiota bacterium]
MTRNLMIVMFTAGTLIGISGCAGPAATTSPTQELSFLEPYILIGESGKSVERTTSDITGRLFMHNFDILGRYAPAGDPNRFVIVVTNRDLLDAVQAGKPTAAFAAAVRIAITGNGKLTYVSFQNPDYWANAYLQEDYISASEQIARFKQDLIVTMPGMRGRFNHPYGGNQDRPLTAEALHTYRFQRQAESLDDLVTLANFSTFESAVATIERRLADSRELTKVFEKTVNEKKARLYGLALKGNSLEEQIITLLDTGQMKHTASLPYEILVLEGQVVMLPVDFRLSLSFPAMDRKTYQRLETLEVDITQLLKTLVE